MRIEDGKDSTIAIIKFTATAQANDFARELNQLIIRGEETSITKVLVIRKDEISYSEVLKPFLASVTLFI